MTPNSFSAATLRATNTYKLTTSNSTHDHPLTLKPQEFLLKLFGWATATADQAGARLLSFHGGYGWQLHLKAMEAVTTPNSVSITWPDYIRVDAQVVQLGADVYINVCGWTFDGQRPGETTEVFDWLFHYKFAHRVPGSCELFPHDRYDELVNRFPKSELTVDLRNRISSLQKAREVHASYAQYRSQAFQLVFGEARKTISEFQTTPGLVPLIGGLSAAVELLHTNISPSLNRLYEELVNLWSSVLPGTFKDEQPK